MNINPRRGVIAVLLVWLVLGATAMRTQALDASTELKIVSVDTSAQPEIAITVAVPAKLAGTDLDSDAFTVIESGKKRLPRITRLPTDALAVVLAIDTSGSMEGAAIASARASAIRFVEQMPPQTRVAVVGFSTTPSVIIDFTSDVAALRAAIDGVGATGETALYDGITQAASLLATAGDARRALVVLSDGRDTSSAATETTAAEALRNVSAGMYEVSLVTADSDPDALQRLADAGGGRVVPASDPASLEAVYDEIAREIANQYQFTFRAIGTGRTDVQVAVDSGEVHASTSVPLELASRAAAPTAVAPPRVTTGSGSTLGGATWALILGGALIFGALVIGWLTLFRGRTPKSTISSETPRSVSRAVRLGGIVDSATQFAEEKLERGGRRRTLNDALDRAGIDMRPGEFVVLAAAASVAALFFGYLLLGPIFGLALGTGTAIGFRSAVTIKAERRRQKFGEQLGDTLQFLSGSLRAGHGLLQAVDTVAEESESPTREEFGRIVIETRFGHDLDQALAAAADRIGNEDFEWVVQAIGIQREVGGDLAELLDQVAATIRARSSIRRQVRALSAEGRLSAVILFILPLALTGVILTLNPGYLDALVHEPAGNVLIAVGAGLMIIGGFWMRRLVRLRF